MEFVFDWPTGFREEDSLKLLTDDGRTPEHGHLINSPFMYSAQVSL